MYHVLLFKDSMLRQWFHIFSKLRTVPQGLNFGSLLYPLCVYYYQTNKKREEMNVIKPLIVYINVQNATEKCVKIIISYIYSVFLLSV